MGSAGFGVRQGSRSGAALHETAHLIPPPWLWPNLLSLDAPIIAVLWQSFLAWRYSLLLRPSGRVTLFLAVWAIYIGDRLLDVRKPATTGESARHRFYRAHQKLATAVLGVVLAITAAITILDLRPAVLRNGLIPLSAVVAYLAILNFTKTRQVAKELVVAFVFTTGTFLVAWTNDPVSPLMLLAPASAFFLLCLANLTAIEAWEWTELRNGAEPPHGTTRALVRTVRIWVPAITVLTALRAADPWYLAIAFSAGAITLLLFIGRRASIELRRVLVDAAMLTPLLLPFLRTR